MKKWSLEFDAIDPHDLPDGKWKVGIPEWLLNVIRVNGHDKQLGRILLVADVLQGGTTHLYEGWSRPGKDADCFAYVGSPASDYKSLTIVTPAPPKMVFIVFVLPGGTIDEWTWRPRPEEKGKENRPSGIEGKLIWSQNAN